MVFQKIEPNVWKPLKEGDEITGVLVRIEDSKQYKNKVYNLEVREDGKIVQKVVFGSTILDDKLSFCKIGDTVKIVFKGTSKNKKNQDTKVYEVFKDEPIIINQ